MGVTYLNEVDIDCGSGCDVVGTVVCDRWRTHVIVNIAFVISVKSYPHMVSWDDSITIMHSLRLEYCNK